MEKKYISFGYVDYKEISSKKSKNADITLDPKGAESILDGIGDICSQLSMTTS